MVGVAGRGGKGAGGSKDGKWTIEWRDGRGEEVRESREEVLYMLRLAVVLHCGAGGREQLIASAGEVATAIAFLCSKAANLRSKFSFFLLKSF